MYNANENKEKARILIQAYLSNVAHTEITLCLADFQTLLLLSMDFEKGKVPPIRFLRGLYTSETSGWSPSGYSNNQFEYFVKDQGSKPAQTLYPLISLKEAKDIVDWLAAQQNWFS